MILSAARRVGDAASLRLWQHPEGESGWCSGEPCAQQTPGWAHLGTTWFRWNEPRHQRASESSSCDQMTLASVVWRFPKRIPTDHVPLESVGLAYFIQSYYCICIYIYNIIIWYITYFTDIYWQRSPILNPFKMQSCRGPLYELLQPFFPFFKHISLHEFVRH
jgi:hypothetical protein